MLAGQRQDGKGGKIARRAKDGNVSMCVCVCETEIQRRGVQCYVKVGSQLDNG